MKIKEHTSSMKIKGQTRKLAADAQNMVLSCG
ncbi:Uncharacterised protein [Streptococcus pneumoniae]|nr:Uncharacterised protein [Streptococcus pneumoniae]